MKTKLLVLGIFFLLSIPFVSAQNALPDPHNDACWQSMDSLRTCQLAAYNREMDYAQRCTPYPEYQCLPADEGKTKNIEAANKPMKQKKGTNATAAGNKYDRRALDPVAAK